MQLEVLFTLECGSHCLENMGIAFISLKCSGNIDKNPLNTKSNNQITRKKKNPSTIRHEADTYTLN